MAPLATSFNRLLVLTPLLAHRDATNFRRKWIRKIGRQMYKLRNHRVNADDISIIPKVFWSRGVYFYGAVVRGVCWVDRLPGPPPTT